MNRYENDGRYPLPYRQGHLPPAHRPASVVGNSRNDHYVQSPHKLPSKDPTEQTNRWDRRPVHENYAQQNNRTPYQGGYQYNKHESPYSYTPRESDYDKPEPSVRREYSPVRRERSRDGSFKGFTSPFPGSETGHSNENFQDDVRRKTYPAESHHHEQSNQRYQTHLSSASNKNLHNPTDGRYRPYMNYNQPPGNDYASESYRQMKDKPLERRYAASEVGSSFSQRGRSANQDYDRMLDGTSTYENNAPGCDPDVELMNSDQSRLSPRTFQRECQRAYYDARSQRMRNLEEGLYGKCKWATYDSKYC